MESCTCHLTWERANPNSARSLKHSSAVQSSRSWHVSQRQHSLREGFSGRLLSPVKRLPKFTFDRHAVAIDHDLGVAPDVDVVDRHSTPSKRPGRPLRRSAATATPRKRQSSPAAPPASQGNKIGAQIPCWSRISMLTRLVNYGFRLQKPDRLSTF